MSKNKNTLFLGNGFSRAVAPSIDSWAELFETKKTKIKNYTFLYEKKRLENLQEDESKIKKDLIIDIETKIQNSIQQKENVAQWFGHFLDKNAISNIITTNYDKGIEYIIKRCNYEMVNNESSETIYSIRRCKTFLNKENNHEIILWKIHGDIDNIKSITLGYDQYCGSLSKLTSYIKCRYESSRKSKKDIGKVSIENKCKNKNNIDNSSWAELFFFSNIHILGFGMDFSEIDIWWLLNKRARMYTDNKNLITNNIFYYTNPIFDKNKEDIFEVLEVFNVNKIEMNQKNLLDFMKNFNLK